MLSTDNEMWRIFLGPKYAINDMRCMLSKGVDNILGILFTDDEGVDEYAIY